jgi:N-acetylglucosamine-6-sulfatase
MDISVENLTADDTISKEVMHDFLHIAPKGYDILAEAIRGKVKETVGGK